jgi:hypothetical protein
VLIQSNSRDPIYLNDRIETFLREYFETVQVLSEEEFIQNKQAVIENLLEKPKNIYSVTVFYWSLFVDTFLGDETILVGDFSINVSFHPQTVAGEDSILDQIG